MTPRSPDRARNAGPPREAGTPACRTALVNRLGKVAHAGLLLASYLKIADDKKGEAKLNLLKEAILASHNSGGIYAKAFARWKQHTPECEERNLTVRGRLVIGLGTESVLETGLSLHHTYGTPIIPGTGLKGLASHYCDQVWGSGEQEFRRKIEFVEGGKKKTRCGKYYETLFGTTEDAGHILFHDAWILPESLIGPTRGLVLDVMTPHHGDYYMTPPELAPAPTDFDDPNPVTFLSVAGDFRVVVGCDAADAAGKEWLKLGMRLVTDALAHWGVGGKTNSGYGRLDGGPRR